MNSDGRKAVGHEFYIKSQMIFLPVYNCRTLAQQSTNSSQALKCAQQRAKAALSPSMVNETQRAGNERNFIHLRSIKLI